MSAIVTSVPSPLGDVTNPATFTTFPSGQEGVGFKCGPWWVTGGKTGAAWYALAENFSTGNYPQIWKSIDDRKTWQLVASGDTHYSLYNSNDPVGTVISMVITDSRDVGPPASPPRILTFDFSTESFNAASIPHTTVSTLFTGVTNFQIVVQPSGTTWLFFNGFFGAAVDHLNYITFSAGAWSAKTVLYTSANATGNFPHNDPLALFLESSGRFHLWWADANAADTTNFIVYVQVSALGVVGAPATIYTISAVGVSGFFNNFTTLANSDGTRLFFTLAAFDSADSNCKIGCLVGTPLNAPVWSFVPVDSGAIIPQPGTGKYVERDSAVVIDSSGNVVVFFSLVSANGPINTIISAQIWKAQWNGATFNPSVLFFDASGTTKFPNQGLPANSGINPMFGLSMMPVQRVGDTTWTVMVSTNFNSPQNNSTYNYVISGPSLSVACPTITVFTEGVPFSEPVQVTGGLAPFNFSILAGSLPTGLTLNPTTGVISGTPTQQGTFPVTIRVVDSA